MTKDLEKRAVYIVSDRTGNTAELIAQTLLTQFDGIDFDYHTFPFVNTESDATMVADKIKKNAKANKVKPLVFCTLVDSEFQKIIASTNAFIVDLFFTFIEPLEGVLQAQSSHTMGKSHENLDDLDYNERIEAIDFSISSDDGIQLKHYDNADVILIGVSRCGKTPTCLYMAMHFSIKAANYPLTDDDLNHDTLPPFLEPYTDKIIGLTIDPVQLCAIRQQRRPNSDYATLEKCRDEILQAEKIMSNAGLIIINATTTSIEEMAVQIVKQKDLLARSQT